MKKLISAADLRCPGHFIQSVWFLLLAVGLYRVFDPRRLCCPAVTIDTSCSAVRAGCTERVTNFPLSDASTLCSEIRQHFGQIVAAAELLYDPSAGQTVIWQEVDGSGSDGAVGLTNEQGGRCWVFEELPLSPIIHFLQVFVEQRRQVDLWDRQRR